MSQSLIKLASPPSESLSLSLSLRLSPSLSLPHSLTKHLRSEVRAHGLEQRLQLYEVRADEGVTLRRGEVGLGRMGCETHG